MFATPGAVGSDGGKPFSPRASARTVAACVAGRPVVPVRGRKNPAGSVWPANSRPPRVGRFAVLAAPVWCLDAPAARRRPFFWVARCGIVAGRLALRFDRHPVWPAAVGRSTRCRLPPRFCHRFWRVWVAVPGGCPGHLASGRVWRCHLYRRLCRRVGGLAVAPLSFAGSTAIAFHKRLNNPPSSEGCAAEPVVPARATAFWMGAMSCSTCSN